MQAYFPQIEEHPRVTRSVMRDIEAKGVCASRLKGKNKPPRPKGGVVTGGPLFGWIGYESSCQSDIFGSGISLANCWISLYCSSVGNGTGTSYSVEASVVRNFERSAKARRNAFT